MLWVFLLYACHLRNNQILNNSHPPELKETMSVLPVQEGMLATCTSKLMPTVI